MAVGPHTAQGPDSRPVEGGLLQQAYRLDNPGIGTLDLMASLRAQVQAAGYAVICYANAALQASMLAMQQVLGHLAKEGSITGVEDQLMMFAERQKVLDASRYQALEKKYS